MKQPKRNLSELVAPSSDGRIWTQSYHRCKPRGHPISKIKRTAPAHAMPGNVNTLRINATIVHHAIQQAADRFRVRPDLARRTLWRNNYERKIWLTFQFVRQSQRA